MIYLIFTQDGFKEALATLLEEKATLWMNNDTLSEQQLTVLKQGSVNVHYFAENVDANNEKSILTALKEVEDNAPQAEIFVEYL